MAAQKRTDQGSDETHAKLQALRAIVRRHRMIYVMPHDYPDPDAFASAAALHLLLRDHFHVRSRIVFSGGMTRAENREMLRHCRFPWHQLSALRPAARSVGCLFVDVHPGRANVTIPSYGKPIGVIDHHAPPRSASSELAFVDIRANVGATVTIVYEYLRAAGVSIPSWLASLMAYAIATETLDLSRKWTPEDRDAYVDLLIKANLKTLGSIRHAPLPPEYYIQLQHALRNIRVYGRVAWSHIDHVTRPEIVPEVADFLLRMERITWSFCTAYFGRQLVVSVRSGLSHANCGKVLAAVMKRLGGLGGGHEWMAGGALDLRSASRAKRFRAQRLLVRGLLQAIERKAIPDSVIAHPARRLSSRRVIVSNANR